MQGNACRHNLNFPLKQQWPTIKSFAGDGIIFLLTRRVTAMKQKNCLLGTRTFPPITISHVRTWANKGQKFLYFCHNLVAISLYLSLSLSLSLSLYLSLSLSLSLFLADEFTQNWFLIYFYYLNLNLRLRCKVLSVFCDGICWTFHFRPDYASLKVRGLVRKLLTSSIVFPLATWNLHLCQTGVFGKSLALHPTRT